LVEWHKSLANLMMERMVPRADTLGCINAWKVEPSGNWTTAIESTPTTQAPHFLGLEDSTAESPFWTSANYINWSFVGNLSGLSPDFAIGLQDCSDFYPAPGGPANR
jgi:hypothetical protein